MRPGELGIGIGERGSGGGKKLDEIAGESVKGSGCCIVKDAVKYEFPVREAIRSILPLCDEFVVGVGKSDDGTLELVKSLPGVTFFESEWDEDLREGGKVLSQETNKAIARCSGDWLFSIQADEVLHERTLPSVREALVKYLEVSEVQGLLFDYIHFYGSYSVYQKSFAWYPHEVRIVRAKSGILSQGDAKGFRCDGRKLNVVHSGGVIHHYGWVRSPGKTLEKRKAFYRFWHEDTSIEKEFGGLKEYPLWKNLSTLEVFKGIHPAVMKERMEKSALRDYPEELKKRSRFKDCRLSAINCLYRLGMRGSKNYRLMSK